MTAIYLCQENRTVSVLRELLVFVYQ